MFETPSEREYVLKLLSVEDDTGNKTIRGSTWLQKMMYVASKDHPDMNYDFKPYKYGMYSKNLHAILTQLRNDNLVCMEETEEDSNPVHLTALGRKDAKKYSCAPEIQDTLQSIKSELNQLSYQELIVLMYTKFPEMLEKCTQKEKYEKWREHIAVSMVKDDKVSFLLGVQMSGLDRDVFADRLEEPIVSTLPC